MPTALTDDELLDIPLANLMPGELKRVFLVQAQETEKKHEAERMQLADLMAERTTANKERNAEDTHRREAQLLAALEAQEELIAEERRELDKRTIRLDDGRRVYVDGDKYRDEKGHELNDADRAQAEVHHLEFANAATWQEKHHLDETALTVAQMRQKVEKLQAGGTGAESTAAVSAVEKQLRTLTKNADPKASTSDYSDLDYMSLAGGSTAKPTVKGSPGSPAF